MSKDKAYDKLMDPHHHWMMRRLYAILDEENVLHRVDPEFLEDVEFVLVTSNPAVARDRPV